MIMKRFVLAVLLASSALFNFFGINTFAQAASEDDAWQVLQKAAVAARALSYQGIFVYQNGQQTKSVQITHFFNGQGEFARNVVLDGQPREVFSQGHDLVIFNQKNEKVIIEKRRGQNMFPGVLPPNLDSIKQNYSLRAGQPERVAGHDAQMFFLHPNDSLRYSYKFWIDSEYGLLLKSEMVNSRNEVLEHIGFTQVALMNTVDLDWFQPKIDSNKSYVMEDEVAITIEGDGASNDWTIKALPAGYRKVDQMKRLVHGKTVPVTHVIFSDGLASVSLFIEPTAKNMVPQNALKIAGTNTRNLPKVAPKTAHSIVGNASFYTTASDGYLVTAVGEVPEATVAQIANAVVFNK